VLRNIQQYSTSVWQFSFMHILYSTAVERRFLPEMDRLFVLCHCIYVQFSGEGSIIFETVWILKKNEYHEYYKYIVFKVPNLQ
jgi:hypothetical protein